MFYLLTFHKTKNCTDSDPVKQGDHNPLLTFLSPEPLCKQCI